MNKHITKDEESLDKRTDILLIMNKEEGRIYGMKGLGKYDEFETAEVNLKSQEHFKRFNRTGSLLSGFLTNFFSEMQNPYSFKFFIVPELQAVELANKIQSSVNSPSKEGHALMQKYELWTDHFLVGLEEKPKTIGFKQRSAEQPKLPMKSKGRKV